MQFVIDGHDEFREAPGKVSGNAFGLFGAGPVVQSQCAGFDTDVADSAWVRWFGWITRFHCGLLVSGTIRPLSISTWRAAALRAQCFARQPT